MEQTPVVEKDNLRKNLGANKIAEQFMGLQIQHTKFGKGNIQGLQDGKLTIQFNGEQTRIFRYPETFESFLTFTEPHTELEAIIEADIQTVQQVLGKQKQQMEDRVKAKAKRKVLTQSPIAVKLPYCFGELCPEFMMAWNTKQRGCMCSSSVCGALNTKNGLSYTEVKEQLDYGGHTCVSHQLINNGTLEIADELDINPEQIVVLVAYPYKAKATERVVMGVGIVQTVEHLWEKETTLIQFDKSKLILLSEPESSETNFTAALPQIRRTQMMFSTHKKMTFSEAIEVIRQIQEPIETTDSRYEISKELLNELIELQKEEKTTKAKRGRPASL